MPIKKGIIYDYIMYYSKAQTKSLYIKRRGQNQGGIIEEGAVCYDEKG